MVLSSRTMAWAVVLLLAGAHARAAEGLGQGDSYPDAAIPEFPETTVSAPAPKTGVQIQSRRRARPEGPTLLRPAVVEAAEPAVAVEPVEPASPAKSQVQQTSAVTSTPVRAPVYGSSAPPTAQPVSATTRSANASMGHGHHGSAPCSTCPGGSAHHGHGHLGRHGGGHKVGTGRGDESHPPGPFERLKFKYDNYWKPGLQEKFWGYPEEFGEKPLGYWVYAHARTQTANGEAARMVLYNMDFVDRSDALTPRGQLQLGRIAYLAPQNFFPIIVESTPNEPELAEKRRMKVLEILQASNYPVPAERVVVSRAVASPLKSFETEPIQSNFNDVLDTGGIADPQTIIRLEGANDANNQ